MLLVKTQQGYLPLENRTNFSITTEYEGEQSLSFDISPLDPYYVHLKEEAQLRYEDNDYLIKSINQRKDIATITACLNMDVWNVRIHRHFDHKEILFSDLINLIQPNDWIIEGAGSVIGHADVDMTGCSDYEILMECKKLYGMVYEYHTAEKTLKIVHPERIQTRGLYMSDELNLQNLEFKGTSSHLLTRLYAYGKKTEVKDSEGDITEETYVNFAAVNGGKEYIDNQAYSDKVISAYWQDDKITDPEVLLNEAIEKLKALSIPERSYSCKLIDLSRINPKYRMLDFQMYDKPTLIDHNSGLYITHQIVQYKRYPDNEKNNEVALSTAFKNITGTIDGMKQSLSNLDTEVKQNQNTSNELIRDVASNTARIKNTYTKGETDTIITSTVQQSADEINQSIQTLEETVHTIDTNLYHAVLQKSGSILSEENSEIELACILYEWSKDVTKNIPAIAFNWKRRTGDLANDAMWNESHKGLKSILLTSADIDESASFGCEVNAAAGTVVQTSYETIIDETDLIMPSVVMYSDMPVFQQYHPDEKTYHPDWSNMTVYPIVTINGTEMDLKDARIDITYKRKDGAAQETDLIAGEAVLNGKLTISKNMLASAASKMITYVGYVAYKGKIVHDSISFSLVQDGEKGIAGEAGLAGKDAAERYTWIAYADAADGTNMSSDPNGKKFLGVSYNQMVKTPSTNPLDYSWALIKGDKGEKGSIGETLSAGKMLNRDPVFQNGYNGITAYNRLDNENVTIERIAKQADCPTDSQYEVKVKNSGNSAPGCGGFYFATTSRSNAIFIYRILAKIPIGRSLLFSSNAAGDGYTSEWLTSQIGTGKYCEYLCKVTCGTTGTFSSTGFFYVDGNVGTSSASLEWYIAYATCFDMTDVETDYSELIIETKQQITEEYNTAIQQTKEIIVQSVEKVQTIADEHTTLISGLKNTVELTEEQTSFIKTTMEQFENTLDGKVDANTIQEWARFNGSTLELGASNSIFKAILTNSELGFYQSGTKVAWISNNELRIIKASIVQYLTIGKAKVEWSDKTGFTVRW